MLLFALKQFVNFVLPFMIIDHTFSVTLVVKQPGCLQPFFRPCGFLASWSDNTRFSHHSLSKPKYASSHNPNQRHINVRHISQTLPPLPMHTIPFQLSVLLPSTRHLYTPSQPAPSDARALAFPDAPWLQTARTSGVLRAFEFIHQSELTHLVAQRTA
jgi:hypothetical protein